MLAAMALLPILVVGTLLVAFRWPAARAMPLAFVSTAALAILVWQLPVFHVAAAAIRGLLVAVSLLYIVFGAVLLLETLRSTGALTVIRNSFTGLSPDPRIQVIIVAWLFGSFIEGAAGFGTPAAICVPLLVGIGFPPLAAVTSGMLIQCTPVSFGAAGTPILVGVSNGLDGDGTVIEFMSASGISDFDSLLQDIATRVALLHGLIGTFIPLLLVCNLTKFFGEQRSFREGLAVAPFALFAGLAMTIPYVLAAFFLGPAFPALIGSLIGLALVTTAARCRWLTPKITWQFQPPASWPADWTSPLAAEIEHLEESPTAGVKDRAISQGSPDGTETSVSSESRSSQPPHLSNWLAWLPYALVAILLLLSRLWPPLAEAVRSVHLDWQNIFGTQISSTTIKPLELPGTTFILVSLIAWQVHRASSRDYGQAWLRSGRVLLSASVALLAAVPMVQIFIFSDGGQAGYDSMPKTLAISAANIVSESWPLVSPYIGGLGAFVAGSNTLSNMMFSSFQFNVAQSLDYPPQWIVALQAVGGAAGNMICVHNVVAACAVVGMLGREGRVLRRTSIPFLIYAGLAGLLGLVVTTTL